MDSTKKTDDESQRPDATGAEEEFPVWFRRVMIVCITISAMFMIVALVYPRIASIVNPPDAKPAWKKTANEIVDIAISKKTDRIPELISHLDSGDRRIRRNAEWALFYMTGLPWATKTEVCLDWWDEYGDDVLAGKEPEDPGPAPERFDRTVSPSKANVNTSFNLLSSKRMVLSNGTSVLEYEFGLVNNNEGRMLRIFPPDELPYRAYRYGAKIPESVRKKNGISRSMAKVPVHLQYGPSVVFVFLEWFNPLSIKTSFRQEFLEFTVLGRKRTKLQPGEAFDFRKTFPIHPKEDLFSDVPQLTVKLTLDGRDLLAKFDGEEVRVQFDNVSRVVHLFRRNPEEVPGYTDEELSRLKSEAKGEGYVLERAERMRVGAYSRSTGTDGDGTSTAGENSSTNEWTTGANRPSDPRTFAGNSTDVGPDPGRLIYDPELKWGEIREGCKSCTTGAEGTEMLSKVRGYLGRFSSVKRARSAIDRRSGRRWVLVFRKRSGTDQEKEEANGSGN